MYHELEKLNLTSIKIFNRKYFMTFFLITKNYKYSA